MSSLLKQEVNESIVIFPITMMRFCRSTHWWCLDVSLHQDAVIAMLNLFVCCFPFCSSHRMQPFM